MDHRQFVAALPQEQRTRLTGRADRPGLLRLACHAGGILLLGALIALRVPFWPLLMLPQGVLIVFLFTALHETIHGTAFRTGWLNDWTARACGFLILLPADWFRYFHFAHHRFTQDPDNDPELAEPKPETVGQYVVHMSGLRVWRSHLATLARNTLGRCDDAFVPAPGRAKVAREARVMVALYGAAALVSIAAGSAVLLYVWVLPAVLGQPFLRLYLLAEHGRCPFVANMLENSRTTFTNALVRWVAWNMPYHAEHHSWPGVPFHRLPDLHELTRAHLGQTENGYARFHRKYVGGLEA